MGFLDHIYKVRPDKYRAVFTGLDLDESARRAPEGAYCHVQTTTERDCCYERATYANAWPQGADVRLCDHRRAEAQRSSSGGSEPRA